MLSYCAITSLDGYVTDSDGRFDWGLPDQQVHEAINEVERGFTTYLYGRRMYEVMAAWETYDGPSSAESEFASIWRSAEKIVYSTTLADVSSARTVIERRFDRDAVRALSETTDVLIGGPTIAASAFRARLIGEVQLFISPVIVGSGLRTLPGGIRLDLELVAERVFGNGVLHASYRVR